ncbi:RpsF [Desulforapulum autotrophicum HRM2]|uniref:Small ribosomal subunit protein bS6 n=1 Tax=Desulforapulum autotrophicum (strain ATCC 43914 / DSM 3382 / VKM B-1955 / HRM2) TaxID=177437 RepID=RS6_DESAH|nr:30S ribosomal protein S6 [Desulforapulum autotrophicum]C0QBV4.1 RecName: Full=Small ribosomal subunit protein bS6; AltName: Full=30S ribosomal protein S6 [Desulforapulum autotrophicum HRM2]ACN14966.1 RpsF [Desulforapulum autotrophicum HRM2]
MRMYETIFITDPDLQDEVRNTLFDRFKGILEQEGGILANFDDWGNKKLAYEIAKKPRGHYVCMTYGGTGTLVTELERNFRLDDKILKYMTILLEKDIDPEALKLQIDAEAAAKSEADAAKAEADAARVEAEAKKAETDETDETVDAETPENEEEN